jgi:hypothetical protein
MSSSSRSAAGSESSSGCTGTRGDSGSLAVRALGFLMASWEATSRPRLDGRPRRGGPRRRRSKPRQRWRPKEGGDRRRRGERRGRAQEREAMADPAGSNGQGRERAEAKEAIANASVVTRAVPCRSAPCAGRSAPENRGTAALGRWFVGALALLDRGSRSPNEQPRWSRPPGARSGPSSRPSGCRTNGALCPLPSASCKEACPPIVAGSTSCVATKCVTPP